MSHTLRIPFGQPAHAVKKGRRRGYLRYTGSDKQAAPILREEVSGALQGQLRQREEP